MQESVEQGRSGVLALLKREGPVSADRLAEHLGVTAMAVRQHLYALASEGLAVHDEQRRARGRPVKLWRTTDRANARFAAKSLEPSRVDAIIERVMTLENIEDVAGLVELAATSRAQD